MDHVYRFLLSPRWIVAHVVVVAIAALFVSLGFWQLRRLDERRAFNALVEQRLAAPQEPLARVLGQPPDDLAYRRVSVTGSYLPSEEVLLSPRSRNGMPGHDVLTPLVTDTGTAVLVDRGWVPFELSTPPVAGAAPPAGQVTVTGFLLPGRPTTRFGPVNADRLEFVGEADVARLAHQVSEPLAPAYLVLAEQTPAQPDLPRPSLPPVLDEGSHLAYAGQWFLFALVGLVGYPALVRRRARDLAGVGIPMAVAARPPPPRS